MIVAVAGFHIVEGGLCLEFELQRFVVVIVLVVFVLGPVAILRSLLVFEHISSAIALDALVELAVEVACAILSTLHSQVCVYHNEAPF